MSSTSFDRHNKRHVHFGRQLSNKQFIEQEVAHQWDLEKRSTACKALVIATQLLDHFSCKRVIIENHNKYQCPSSGHQLARRTTGFVSKRHLSGYCFRLLYLQSNHSAFTGSGHWWTNGSRKANSIDWTHCKVLATDNVDKAVLSRVAFLVWKRRSAHHFLIDIVNTVAEKDSDAGPQPPWKV